MPDYLLKLTLTEPLTLGHRPVISNEIQGLDYIPGTTLRGSLAAALVFAGRGADLARWFESNGPRWSPAFPDVGKEGFAVPMPASFVADKGDGLFGTKYPVFNTLLGTPPIDAAEYSRQTDEEAEPHRFQWGSVRATWLKVVAGQPAGLYHVPMEASMHVGLHYGRQANKSEALFSRREIAAGVSFSAWVKDPGPVIADGPEEVFLGKRRSAGNGHATVEWIPECACPWVGPRLLPHEHRVNVQLMSDCIVRNATGSYYRGFPDALWSEWIGVPCRVEAAASASRLVMGWSSGSGLARAQALAVTAGSVFRLENRGDLGKFQEGLMRLALDGIGERRHEGFGWLSVNPTWLAARSTPPQPKVRRISETPPAAWPGLENVRRDVLEAALRDAESVDARGQEFAKKVGQLAAYAARVKSQSEVADYAARLGDRPHDRGWKDVRDRLSDLILKRADSWETVFFLNALATQLERAAQDAE